MARLPSLRGFCRFVFIVAGFIMGNPVANTGCFAYTASGDRIFAPTGILPQIAPADQFYAWWFTQPHPGGAAAARNRLANIGAFLDKTVTERFSVYFQENRLDIERATGRSQYGFGNVESGFKYLIANELQREFLLTLGVNREWGATGASRVAAAKGATEPRVYFGKGLGDLDIGYLRPLAVTGFVGYLSADAPPRPDLVRGGFAVQYSIPYLQSKVQSFDIPNPMRGLTPITEVLLTTPAGRSFGARTTAMVAPGVTYAGEGWEFLIEALLPASRATGNGAGIRAQLYLALDYLFPTTIGRPLLAPR